MRLRSFTASSMPGAIQMVREELGENAIIIASEQLEPKGIKVTAAIEEDDAPASINTASRSTQKTETQGARPGSNLRFTLQNTLRFHNLPELFIAKIMQKISDKELAAIEELLEIGGQLASGRAERMALEKMLGHLFRFAPLKFSGQPIRIMLAGSPGIGKTFTIAKVASRLAMDGQPFAVITTDNKRAGGIEQLKAYTDILQTKLHVASSQKVLAQTLSDIPGDHHVLIDTAGCNAYSPEQMAELAQLAQLKAIEPILVMAAGGDSLEAIDTVEPFSALPIERLLVTRADTARRFGSVLAVAAAYGFAFGGISASSSIADKLQNADSTYLAELLLQYQLQT